MDLKTMFVMKTGTKVEGMSPNLPYQFSAESNKDGNPLGNVCRIVNIVMPLGGSQSALFRYPKEGEKVLVGVDDGDNSYLLGYVPEKDTNDNIYTKAPGGDYLWPENPTKDDNMVLPEEMAGQFFRYKGPDNTTSKYKKDYSEGKAKYSEIGFYNERTKWNSEDSDDENPLIDTLKIVSAGDIHQKATNHHQTKAKRFELLVNCEGSESSDKGSEEELAFGDLDGDNPELFAGDAHIRAKNRVVIKAGSLIELRVGRSTLFITDQGIRIEAKRTRSNVESGWDASINLEPLTGLVMTGKKIIGRGGLGFDLSEMYGGSINSQLGVVRVGGLDIRLATLGSKNYLYRVAANGLDFVQNSFLGMNSFKTPEYLSEHPHSYSTFLRISGGALAGIFGGSEGLKEYDINDMAGTMMFVYDIIMLLTLVAGYVLEPILFSEKELREEKSDKRGSFYAALAMVEYGTAFLAATYLEMFTVEGILWESVVHLSGKGNIALDTKDIMLRSVKMEGDISPISGINEKEPKSLWENIKEAKREIIEFVAGGVEAFGDIYGREIGEAIGEKISGKRSANEEFYEELWRL